MKRKIAAILAADVAGYSRLVAEHEEEAIARLGSYREVFDALIVKFGGRIFNTAGDAVMAEFPSAVEAVRCAVDVQESLRTRNLSVAADRQMHFRIGISIGDVIERGADLLGDGVNIAARLEGLASPGGICVSRSVYEQVTNKVSIKFADIGEQVVKNIPTPVHAYMVGEGTLPARAAAPATGTTSRKPLIAAGITGAAVLAAGVWFATGGRIPGISPAPAIVYAGPMECDQLPWTTGPYRGQAKITVTGNVAEFSRAIYGLDGKRFTGFETGTGSIDASGNINVSAVYAGSGSGRIDAVYTGRLDERGGSIHGRHVASYQGRRHERECRLELKRT